MRTGRNEIAAALLLALSSPAMADPIQDQLDQRVRGYEEYVGHPKPMPIVPLAMRDIVSATRDTVVVQALDGRPIVIDITELEPTDFATYLNGRFVGFAFDGPEYYGYRLVDRAERNGYPFTDTGSAPSFSPDNRFFVGAEMSGSGFGNLNGLGLWQVLEHDIANRFFTDVFPPAFDWRVDQWLDPECVLLSAVDQNWQPPENADQAEALRQAPRVHYALRVGDVITLSTSTGESGCTDMGEAP